MSDAPDRGELTGKVHLAVEREIGDRWPTVEKYAKRWVLIASAVTAFVGATVATVSYLASRADAKTQQRHAEKIAALEQHDKDADQAEERYRNWWDQRLTRIEVQLVEMAVKQRAHVVIEPQSAPPPPPKAKSERP